MVRQYIWLGDEPIAVFDGSTDPSNPTIDYVHADHLQRPELMTDATGAVVWRATYEPFGAVSSVTGPIVENQRLPGQWFQLETGLAYNWYRHYDATTGRYTSPDPTGTAGGRSLYGYAGQSPLMLTDARGLDNPGMGPYDPPPPPPPSPDPGCDNAGTHPGGMGGSGSGAGGSAGDGSSYGGNGGPGGGSSDGAHSNKPQSPDGSPIRLVSNSDFGERIATFRIGLDAYAVYDFGDSQIFAKVGQRIAPMGLSIDSPIIQNGTMLNDNRIAQ